jgi:acetyl esterase
MSKLTHQMQAVIEAHMSMGPLPIEQLSPEQARQMPLTDRAAMAVYGQHFTKRALASMPEAVGHIEHRLIPGPAGSILTRIYTPRGETPALGWPVLLYFHGGGWVIGTLDTYDASCRALCDKTECVVMSVHYRQAPEHPWPAATDDAYAAYQWLCSNAQQIRCDPTRIAIGGESAGGNLAAVTTLMARDNGAPLLPVCQLLIYPVVDLATGLNSPSAKEHAQARPLSSSMLRWFYSHYLPEGVNPRNPAISPLHAKDLRDLSPVTIIAAEIDPLRSEGQEYARLLQEAGVVVNYKLYSGVTHEFFGMRGIVDEADEAISVAAGDLRIAFNFANQYLHSYREPSEIEA